MTVIGLDLSLTATGMSDGSSSWLITSSGRKDATLTERRQRLDHLLERIATHLTDHAPTLVVLEGPSLGQARQGGQHDRAGLWWLVVDWCHDQHTPIAEVPPAALKKYATGKGNANKGAMIEATTRRLPHVDTAGDDNRCDAVWLAALGHEHLGHPLLELPAINRQAVSAVRWPDLAPLLERP